MNAYELISPLTGNPCGVYVCGVCNKVVPKVAANNCCKPCACGKPARNRHESRCEDCCDAIHATNMTKRLEDAELIKWDGEAMIFSEDVMGYFDGWFASPDDLREYLYDEEIEDRLEFAFVGRKRVATLDLDRAIEQMLESVSAEAELEIDEADKLALQTAVDAFNAKYAIIHYTHEYKRKVRVAEQQKQEEDAPAGQDHEYLCDICGVIPVHHAGDVCDDCTTDSVEQAFYE